MREGRDEGRGGENRKGKEGKGGKGHIPRYSGAIFPGTILQLHIQDLSIIREILPEMH